MYPNAGPGKGIELDILDELRTDWLQSFDWEAQQAALNELNHYTVKIGGQTVHSVHEKSTDPNAIPVILLHGWPGSFQEFLPVIKPLTETSANVSFNVVVPSLVFSSAPPFNWTVEDTARIFNTLMTEVWDTLLTRCMNPTALHTVYTKAATDAPMLFSQYEYNAGFWPEEYVAEVGNLVSYKFHDFGGHFAGLDNPPYSSEK
ncbi:Alpha/Beta hydrolase protein [Mycena epipterygia]|nr:Alpha/Beta hydrolase protein [Mycena epipterygia]